MCKARAEMDSLSLCRRKVSDVYRTVKVSNVLVFLPFCNFAFKEFHGRIACLSHISLSSQLSGFLKKNLSIGVSDTI